MRSLKSTNIYTTRNAIVAFKKKKLHFAIPYFFKSEFCRIFIKMMTPLARISNKLGRNVMTNFVRHHSHGGVPGENLPFDIQNRYKLTALFIVYAGSGLAAPYLITRHQILKA